MKEEEDSRAIGDNDKEQQREDKRQRGRYVVASGILAEPNTIYEEMGSVAKPQQYRIHRPYGEDVSTFYPEAGLYGDKGLAQLRNEYNIEVPEHIQKLIRQNPKEVLNLIKKNNKYGIK